MFNPSPEWIAIFDSLERFAREQAMRKLTEDWGSATIAIGQLMRGGTIVPVFNRDAGIMLPGQSIESAIMDVFINIRVTRYQHAKMDAIDYRLLEQEYREYGNN